MNASAPHDMQSRFDALDVSKSVVVSAPAGSGKTGLLTQRYLRALAVVVEPEEVIAITFTNKAAAEIRARVIEALELASSGVTPESSHGQMLYQDARAVLKADNEKGWNLITNPSRLRVMTFDKFMGQIASQNPILSELDATLEIAENPSLLYEEAVLRVFSLIDAEGISPDFNESLEKLLRYADNRVDTLLPMLSNLLSCREQWYKPVLEGDRIENAIEAVASIAEDRLGLVYSYLDRATADNFARAARDCAGSVEQVSWAAHLDVWPEPVYENIGDWINLTNLLTTSSGGFYKTLTARNGFAAKSIENKLINEALSEFKLANDEAAVSAGLQLIAAFPTINEFEADKEIQDALSVVLGAAIHLLKDVFADNNKIDFTEVALAAQKALTNSESSDIATDVQLRLFGQIKHILVDEVQDTSRLQYDVLKKLTKEWASSVEEAPSEYRSIFFVGDVQQSIYMFRMAEVGLFSDLIEKKQFSGIPLETVQLSVNFRSELDVIDWSNELFQNAFSEEGDAATGSVSFTPSIAFNQGKDGAGVEIHPFIGSKNNEEAAKVVQLVKEAEAADPDQTIAVLVRSRSHLEYIVPALKEAGVRFASQDIDSLAHVPAVQDVVGLIKSLWHDHRTDWLQLLRSEFVGLSWADCLAIAKVDIFGSISKSLIYYQTNEVLSEDGKRRIRRLLDVINYINSNPEVNTLSDKVRIAWHRLGGPSCVNVREMGDVQTVFRLLSEHSVNGTIRDMESFDLSLSKLYASPDSSRITLSTIHKAKGLEWDTVILPGVGKRPRNEDKPLLMHKAIEDSFVLGAKPKKHDANKVFDFLFDLKKKSAKNESLRLLYVALTRARSKIHIIGSVRASEEVKPDSNSFLEFLWHAKSVSNAFAAKNEEAGREHAHLVVDSRTPKVKAIPSDWSIGHLPDQFDPAFLSGVLPPDTVFELDKRHSQDEENLTARLVGTVYHSFMERIAKTGLDKWDHGRVESQRKSIFLGLKRMGCEHNDLSDAVNQVVRLIHNSLNCEKGRWILSRQEEAESEIGFVGKLNGKWSKVIIDRLFVDDNKVWIIDYKTGSPFSDKESFLKAQVSEYKSQLNNYEEHLRNSGERREIKKALYFPSLGHLEIV